MSSNVLDNPGTSLIELLLSFEPNNGISEQISAVDVFKAAVPFINSIQTLKEQEYFETLDKLCRYVSWSLEQKNPSISYIACGFLKDYSLMWIDHLKELLSLCLKTIARLQPERVCDSLLLSVLLRTIVSFMSTQGWAVIHTETFNHLEQGMNKLSFSLFLHLLHNVDLFGNIHGVLQSSLSRPGKISLKRANLLALASLANRPLLEQSTKNDSVIIGFVRNILTVPAYVHHVHSVCPEGLNNQIFPMVVEVLQKDEYLSSCLQENDLSLVLSLLANLVQLGSYSPDLTKIFVPSFEKIISNLLDECATRSDHQTKSHWHPILGWVSTPIPSSFLNSAAQIKDQIETLWQIVYLEALFHHLLQFLKEPTKSDKDIWKETTMDANKSVRAIPTRNGILKCLRRVMNNSSDLVLERTQLIKFNAEITHRVARTCNLYTRLITTFPLCKLDILSGICFKQSSEILISLWDFLLILGPEIRLKGWVEFLLGNQTTQQECILVLFLDAMIHFLTVLDDQEIYEDQKVFKLEQLAEMATIINNLCFRFISQQLYSKINQSTLNSVKTLLMILYRRDCRRKYCPDGHWLIENSKMNQLINDIEKGRRNAKRILLEMPHIIREESRVMFFRKWAQSEKTLNGSSHGEHELGTTPSGSALITVQRGRIVEDGYANLANLSAKALKGTIRVRFKNEYGLDEAGIDQDGVFKEFLEETIKAVFTPTLNLFKATNENLLYPSPLSYFHGNHLELFEFVGKMLGKAVYEGIIVDVRFAPFFLSQMLGLQKNTLFSLIDEVQSLDRDLYNSMNYIKHYQGDVKDLELFFSVDQDILGEIKTTEFITGGRAVRVTNDNKISYLYHLAHFHLYVEIKEQTAAFLKGFRSIIPSEWLKIFSMPELQRLISGEDSEIDLVDLRRNTQYYGGFHDNHRVIIWLWEILERDFSEDERRLFLKFVTSCSKPPLLGFVNLEPQFSIRCVEVSEDEDTGDTIGSVVRGFLALGKKEPIGRLPTSSTCFNLLKLPNYQKKSTLREKLRASITSLSGFELS